MKRVYVDEHADINKAIKIAFNAKTHRYGVCNAMETLLVHATVAKKVLPELARLYAEKNVELRGCKQTREIVPGINSATEQDWSTEYLAAILSIRVVLSLDDAITTHFKIQTIASIN